MFTYRRCLTQGFITKAKRKAYTYQVENSPAAMKWCQWNLAYEMNWHPVGFTWETCNIFAVGTLMWTHHFHDPDRELLLTREQNEAKQHWTYLYPGPRGFLWPQRDKRERKKQQEKTSGNEWQYLLDLTTPNQSGNYRVKIWPCLLIEGIF